ncbi:MAG: PQQ-binding-like beta-propeller repeat protein, partial [Planctomycetota bacterium]
ISPNGGSYTISIDFGQFMVNTSLSISNWSLFHNAVFQLKKTFDLNTKDPTTEILSQFLRRYTLDQILSYLPIPPVEATLLFVLSLRGEILALNENLDHLKQFYEKTNQGAKIQQIQNLQTLFLERKIPPIQPPQAISSPYARTGQTPAPNTPTNPYAHTGQTPVPLPQRTPHPVAQEDFPAFSTSEFTNELVPSETYQQEIPQEMQETYQSDLSQAAEGLDNLLPESSNIVEKNQFKIKYLKEIERNPKNIEAYESLLNFYQRENEEDNAYDMAIKLAKIYIKNSKLEPLEALCITYLYKDKDFFLRNTLVNTYLDLGRKDEAINVFRDILSQLENPSEDTVIDYYNKILRIDPTLMDIRESKEKILMRRKKRAQFVLVMKLGIAGAISLLLVVLIFIYNQISTARGLLDKAKALNPEREIDTLPEVIKIVKEEILDVYPSFYPPCGEAQEYYILLTQLKDKFQAHKLEKIKEAQKYTDSLKQKWKVFLAEESTLTNDIVKEYNTDLKDVAKRLQAKESKDLKEVQNFFDPLYQELIQGVTLWMQGIVSKDKNRSLTLKKTRDDLLNNRSDDYYAFGNLAEMLHELSQEIRAHEERISLFEPSNLPIDKTLAELRQIREAADILLKEIEPKIVKKHEEDFAKIQNNFKRAIFNLKEAKKFYELRTEEKQAILNILAEAQEFAKKFNLSNITAWIKGAEGEYEILLKDWVKSEEKAKTLFQEQFKNYLKAIEEITQPNLELIAKNALKTYIREVLEKILSKEEFRWTLTIKEIRFPLFFTSSSEEEALGKIEIYQLHNQQKEKLGDAPKLVEYYPILLENYLLNFSSVPEISLGIENSLRLESKGFEILKPNLENDIDFVQSGDLKIPFEIKIKVNRKALWTLMLPAIKTPEKNEEPGVLEAHPLIDEEHSIVYLATRSGCVYAYNYSQEQNPPELLWSKKLGTTATGFRSTPTLYKNKLYLGSTDGFVYVLDIENKIPENRSKKKTSGEIDSILCSPFIFQDQILFVSQSGLFMMDLDLKKTTFLHEITPGLLVHNYQLLYFHQNQDLLIALNNKKEEKVISSELIILDLKNPEKIYRKVPLSPRSPCNSSPIIHENFLYIGDDSGSLWIVDLENWSTQHKIAKNQPIFSQALILPAQGKFQILVYPTGRSLVAHNLNEGLNPLPNAEIFISPKSIKCGLVFYKNTLYTGSENNLVYSLGSQVSEKTKTLPILWKFQLQPKDTDDKLNILQSEVVVDQKRDLLFVGAANSILYIFEHLE